MYKILIFLVLCIYIINAVSCENERNDNQFLNYDLVKLVGKTAEHIKRYKSIKSISKTDKILINELEKILTISNGSTLLDVFSESTSNKCVEDLNYVFESLAFFSGWSMKMLDSYGKPESGILEGNFRWLGQYDECVGIQAPPMKNNTVGGFRGKYCTLLVPIKLGRDSLPLSTALCLPDSCNPNKTIFGFLQNYNFNGSIWEEKLVSILSNATLTCKPISLKPTTGAYVLICILSIFALLAVIGSFITALEFFMKKRLTGECVCQTSGESINHVEEDNVKLLGTEKDSVLPVSLQKCKPFFNCFCIFTNGEKILNTDSSEGHLPFLHGIRFLSMTWVIVCHIYGAMPIVVKDAQDAAQYIDKWTFQIILNGFFSVDSFFLLSGFLVGYVFFQQAQKSDGKIPWLYFYVHRYIRLTPVYMLVLAFYATISPFLGSGPLWPDYEVDKNCQDSWWWNMLYINNFMKLTSSKMCMGWSWYLANDMQFYIISPLFLITLWRWPKTGYSLTGLFFCIHFIANFVLTYKYHLIAGFGNLLKINTDPDMLQKSNDFYDIIYSKPYTRIGPYLIGIVLAHYIYRRKSRSTPKMNLLTLSAGWVVASGIALACQFGQYHQDFTNLGASFYNSLSRMGFALGLAWLIFVCVIEQGGVVNSILSWKALIPLSRLTYCAYLVHPIILTAYLFSLKTLVNFSHMYVIVLFLGLLVISYAVAMVTSLLFESPVIRLERLIKNKLTSS